MSLKKTFNFNVKPKKTKKRILYQGGSSEVSDEEKLKVLFNELYKSINFTLPDEELLKQFSISPIAKKTFQERILGNLEQFKATERQGKLLRYINLHGSYIDNSTTEHFFTVPPNTIICILQNIGSFGLISKENNFQIPKDPTELFNHIFKYKASISDYNIIGKENFQFEFDYWKKTYHQSQITDLFQNASFYYPGQHCHNARFFISLQDFQKYQLNFSDYEFKDTKWKFKHDFITEGEILSHPEKNIYYNLKNLVYDYDYTSNAKIILVNSCMDYQIGWENFKNLWDFDHLNMKKIMEINGKDISPIAEGNLNLPKYKYFNYNNYNVNVCDIPSVINSYLCKPKKIEEYDKRRRILTMIKERLKEFPTQQIETRFLNFLQAQTVPEVLDFIEEDDIDIDPDNYTLLLNYIFDDQYLENLINGVGYFMYQYIFNSSNLSSNMIEYLAMRKLNFENIAGIRIDKSSDFFKMVNNFMINLGRQGGTGEVLVLKPNINLPVSLVSDKYAETLIIDGNFDSELFITDYSKYQFIKNYQILNNSKVNSTFLKQVYLTSQKMTKIVSEYTLKFQNCGIFIKDIESLFMKCKVLIFDQCEISGLSDGLTLPASLNIYSIYSKMKELKIIKCDLTNINISLPHLDVLEINDSSNLESITGISPSIHKCILKNISSRILPTIFSGMRTITELNLSEMNQVDLNPISNLLGLRVLKLTNLNLSEKFKFKNKIVKLLLAVNITGNQIDLNEIDMSFALENLSLHQVQVTPPMPEKIFTLQTKFIDVDLIYTDCNIELNILKNIGSV